VYRKYIKRALDFVIALIALIILSPVLLVLSALVLIKLGRPVLFAQKRPGRGEKIINMYKFRSMTDARDGEGNLLPDSERLTGFGKTLRSTSLDELPELINILKGDMSIVGPRPQLVKDMVFMTPEQRARHTVLPGLTGLAQINGRNAIGWEDRLKYDLEYIEDITFKKDISIMLSTAGRVVRRSGISQQGMDTSEDLGDYLVGTGEISEDDYAEKMEAARELISR